jgi:uncharacterized protein
MEDSKIIAYVSEKVQELSKHEGSGHDWWHIYRVWRLAKAIGEKENADGLILELAALLHETDDKRHLGISAANPQVFLKNLLAPTGLSEESIQRVWTLIEDGNYVGHGATAEGGVLEGIILREADLLDSTGAIGIARVFMFTGHKGSLMHDPSVQADTEAYRDRLSETAINHFYEKLLLIKDKMTTPTAKKIAEERHMFLEEYLKKFYEEWSATS